MRFYNCTQGEMETRRGLGGGGGGRERRGRVTDSYSLWRSEGGSGMERFSLPLCACVRTCVRACVRVCVCARAHARVCVCVCERERDLFGQTPFGTAQIKWVRITAQHCNTQNISNNCECNINWSWKKGEREGHRETETERQRHRHRDRETKTETEKEREEGPNQFSL